MQKIYFETLGCSKNQVDSEKMLYLLQENDYNITENPEEADYIIINTCCFIKSAKEEAIETIFELSEYKTTGNCKKLIVAGCMAQYYSAELKKEIPEIDAIFGIGDLSKIIDAVEKEDTIILPESTKDSLYKRTLTTYPGSAYLKISDGCSNYCSYCIIPHIRGALRSREINDILKETDYLIKNNIKEINIISQDSANYGIDLFDKKKLPELLLKIDELLKADQWIRLLYMHPDHIDNEFLLTLKEVKHLVPYFDIPFQSGSEKILKLMNRKGNREIYLELINNIRDIFGDAIIRSTFITGFPCETIDDFKETLTFIKEAKIEWIGGFTYSQEEDTKAGNMKEQIKESFKKKRLDTVIELSEEICKKKLQRFINSNQKILIEERVEGEDLFIGRFWGQAPEVDGLTVIESANAKPGDFLNTTIKKLNDKDFYAVEV